MGWPRPYDRNKYGIGAGGEAKFPTAHENEGMRTSLVLSRVSVSHGREATPLRSDTISTELVNPSLGPRVPREVPHKRGLGSPLRGRRSARRPPSSRAEGAAGTAAADRS
eukprot:6555212-Pyramimonas_sp.AAC.1